MTGLLLIRHGETEWNVERRLQGRTDIPLSDEGRAQIRRWRIPDRFRGFHCLASPLTRAVETATLLGLDPEIEPALIEMSWGDWEGKNFKTLREDLGEIMADNLARGLDFRPDGGESPRDVQNRLIPWMARLSQPTVAVCHKGVIHALHALAIGWEMVGDGPDKFQADAAHHFEVEAGRTAIIELNIPLVPS